MSTSKIEKWKLFIINGNNDFAQQFTATECLR